MNSHPHATLSIELEAQLRNAARYLKFVPTLVRRIAEQPPRALAPHNQRLAENPNDLASAGVEHNGGRNGAGYRQRRG